MVTEDLSKSQVVLSLTISIDNVGLGVRKLGTRGFRLQGKRGLSSWGDVFSCHDLRSCKCEE